MVKILSIIDDRAGNNSQVVGISNLVAQYLGQNCEIISIYLDKQYLDSSEEKKIIICAGNKGTKFACKLKRNLKNSMIITSMWPGILSAIYCDVIILSKHDSNHFFFDHKIIRILGSPHKINFLGKSSSDRKFIGVLIGGDHKSGKFTKDMAIELCNILKTRMQEKDSFFMISTSRRTKEEVLETIIQELSKVGITIYNSSDLSQYESGYIYDYRNSQIDNPYISILSSADEIICTGDSISMMSEAMAIQKPLYIYYNKILSGKKHLSMIKEIIDKKYAFDIANKVNKHVKFNYYDLNSYLINKLSKFLVI